MSIGKRARISVATLVFGLGLSATAWGQTGNDINAPFLITADQIVHDRDLNTVTASGNVEIDQDGSILLADTLSYNLKQDIVVATGNVSLTQPTGEVSFADYLELTGDLKRGAARGIRMIMTDDSTMVAKTLRQDGTNRKIMDRAAYTACRACADKPGTAPLWDIRAKRVTHDEDRRVFEYEDAWLDLAGIPALYIPYLEHADPSIKRKSGLMPPSFINNDILGFGIGVPYFQVIDEQSDVTIRPLVTTKHGDQLAATHRWRGMDGQMRTTVSVADLPDSTVYPKGGTGWNISSQALFNLNDTWRAGWQVDRASDRDYLRTYNSHISDPYLTTRPYVEGFWSHSYALLEAYSFQSTSDYEPAKLTTNQNSTQPLVMPLATFSYVGPPSTHGGYWSFDTQAAAFTREKGTNSRRLNSLAAWHLPYTSPSGQLYTLTTSLRVDGYDSDHLQTDDSGRVSTARAIPEASLEWRYPFSKVGSSDSHIISPIVVASLSPNRSNSSKIPNEDSLNFELNDLNIFSTTPYSGHDRVLTGPRVAYGVQYDYSKLGLFSGGMTLGQVYQLDQTDVFEAGTGFDKPFSDIVGSAHIQPSNNFDVGYRFRVDPDTGAMRRSEVTSVIGPRALKLSANYVFFARRDESGPFAQRQQIDATLSTAMSRYWTTQIYSVQNLGQDAGNLQSGVRLIYDDECLSVVADAGQRDTTVKTFSAGHYVIFRFVFKTLTEFPVSVL